MLGLNNLEPSPEVDAAFTNLVDAVVHDTKDDFGRLSASTVLDTRAACQAAESELEKHWAAKVIKEGADSLKSFPYIQNYKELVRREIDEVSKSGLIVDDKSLVLVVGSGPLPLTSYEIVHQTGAHVDNVDSSPEAIKLSEQFCPTCGLDMSHYCCKGEDLSAHDQYDLIVLAAMAGGSDADKQKIIDNLSKYLKPSGRILIRSAKNARKLLYPEVNPGRLSGVELMSEYHPTDFVINSVLIFRKQ